MNRIAIVILNWNGKELLKKFLPSVTTHSNREWADVIIADNASTDHSISFLKDNYPNLQRIQLDKNYGFAEGYNRALAQLPHSYFVLLNSDVEVTENWLDSIYTQFEKYKDIAAAMPKIKAYHKKTDFEYAGAVGGFIDYLGYPFCRGRILDSIEKDTGQYDKNIDIFWASGAAMFVRAEVYKQAGGLDSDFFAHMEEIDLCWRIKNLGYRIICDTNSTVFHVGGATLPNHSSRKLFLNFRNNLLMLYKNLPSHKLLFTFLARMILDGVAAFKFLLSGEVSNFTAVFKAHMSFYSLLKKYNLKRKQSLRLVSKEHHPEIYQNSLIIDYYLKSKKVFSDLNFKH
ncbi:glycosyltransferase [Marinifilum sp. N1E240]|uniref:glycosyltransferase family 2 protein n=1 Tax=Marinifilum sp. N1E240 TaxID=2608082 RepID=UPI00128CFAD5|nr:glycosyltransferase family 2 protein [Marinifilum sp. N1E240]MPQ45950.1 glycosyltransferase [Marinifilum sp. N1E240]